MGESITGRRFAGTLVNVNEIAEFVSSRLAAEADGARQLKWLHT